MSTPNMSRPDSVAPGAPLSHGAMNPPGMIPPAEQIDWAAMLKSDHAVNKAAVRQIEVAVAKQDVVLECCQNAFEHWVARRHRSTQAVADLARASLFAENPHDVITAWTQWSRTALERLSEDAKDHLAVSATVVRACIPGPLAGAAIPTDDAQPFELPVDQKTGRPAEPTVTRRSEASWPGGKAKPGAAPELH